MRFTHPDGTTVHLAYCTNVHGAQSLDGVIAQLGAHCEPVRHLLGTARLGVGLWLARPAATTLAAAPDRLRHLRDELARRGLEVVTLNGFPYQGFGDAHVKYRVYQPDWTRPERADYTLDLARILAALLPEDVTEGTISTLPLGWATAMDGPARTAARAALERLAGDLDHLHDDTGRSVRIAVEPEPGCVVESTDDAITTLRDLPAHRIALCLDTCHLATAFEEPATALAQLRAAGIDVAKTQLSAALHAPTPADPAVRAALSAFDEPRFLHQTRARRAGVLHAADDLGPALAGTGLPDDVPWRAHFHVPLHAPPPPPLSSTTPVLRAALDELVGGQRAACHHLEVETYTWQALPAATRPADDAGLAAGIAAELALARDWLTDLGCKEQQP